MLDNRTESSRLDCDELLKFFQPAICWPIMIATIPKTVLIVEDEAPLADVLEDHLLLRPESIVAADDVGPLYDAVACAYRNYVRNQGRYDPYVTENRSYHHEDLAHGLETSVLRAAQRQNDSSLSL